MNACYGGTASFFNRYADFALRRVRRCSCHSPSTYHFCLCVCLCVCLFVCPAALLGLNPAPGMVATPFLLLLMSLCTFGHGHVSRDTWPFAMSQR